MINWIYDLDLTLYEYHDKSSNNFQYDKIIGFPNLGETIKSLPGKKIMFTNGNLLHTMACVKQLNLKKVFHKVSCRELHGLKPNLNAYYILNYMCSIEPEDTSYFFEDTIDNLIVAKKFGWKTVYIEPNINTLTYVKNNVSEVDYAFLNIKDALEYFTNQYNKKKY